MVTGATGFIGRHALAPLVARGFEVHAVSSRANPVSSPNLDVRQHVCDLLDVAAVERLVQAVAPSHLLHLAWCTEPGRYWTSPDNLRWLQSSLALVAAFRQAGGARVVVASSCAEYDWRYGFLAERQTPVAPKTLYGACKQALTSTLEHYGQQVGLSVAAGRVFFMYGPHEHPSRLVSSVVRALLDGREAPCSLGTQQRDFQHVQDTAGAFVALLDSDVVGPVNIGSGRAPAVRDIVLALADRLQGHALVRFGALPMAADDPPLIVADTRRLAGEVGWTDRFDLASGLDDTIAWWRAQPR